MCLFSTDCHGLFWFLVLLFFSTVQPAGKILLSACLLVCVCFAFASVDVRYFQLHFCALSCCILRDEKKNEDFVLPSIFNNFLVVSSDDRRCSRLWCACSDAPASTMSSAFIDCLSRAFFVAIINGYVVWHFWQGHPTRRRRQM